MEENQGNEIERGARGERGKRCDTFGSVFWDYVPFFSSSFLVALIPSFPCPSSFLSAPSLICFPYFFVSSLLFLFHVHSPCLLDSFYPRSLSPMFLMVLHFPFVLRLFVVTCFGVACSFFSIFPTCTFSLRFPIFTSFFFSSY